MPQLPGWCHVCNRDITTTADHAINCPVKDRGPEHPEIAPTPAPFVTVGYVHNPSTNVDRLHVQTDASLDEFPRLRLSGPDLAPNVFVSAQAVENIMSEVEDASTSTTAAYEQLTAALRALVAPQFARQCLCPDDCGCRQPWRRNVCGCRAH